MNRATARAIGGSHSQAPAYETARNRPIAVAMAASGGHNRSQKVIQRAFFRHQHGPGTIRLGRIWQMDGVCQSVLRTSLSSFSHNKAGPKTKF
jgi:hypothetical protein